MMSSHVSSPYEGLQRIYGFGCRVYDSRSAGRQQHQHRAKVKEEVFSTVMATAGLQCGREIVVGHLTAHKFNVWGLMLAEAQ